MFAERAVCCLEYYDSCSNRAVIIQINQIRSLHSDTSMGNCLTHTAVYLRMECTSVWIACSSCSRRKVKHISVIGIWPFLFQDASNTTCGSVLPSSDTARERLFQLPLSCASLIYIYFTGTFRYPDQPVCITGITFAVYKFLFYCLSIIIFAISAIKSSILSLFFTEL